MTVTLGDPLAPDPDELTRLLAGIASERRWTNSGPLADRLEESLRELIGADHVRVTSSGTTALTVALLALDLEPGAEVITTPLTFVATVAAIEAAGLVPRFAAADPVTLNLDPGAVEAALGARTAAILPVHLFGVAADPALDEVAARHGIPVVYDAAHAFAFAPVASRGAASAYSLHATKILHTGEGGAVATRDPAFAERVARARSFGLDDAGLTTMRGLNAKLPESSAAVGLAMRGRVADELVARSRLRETYRAILARSPRFDEHAPGTARALVMEVVRSEAHELEDLRARLLERGIAARWFPALCAPGSRYEGIPISGASAVDMTALARTVLALPLHGRVTERDIDALAEAVLAR